MRRVQVNPTQVAVGRGGAANATPPQRHRHPSWLLAIAFALALVPSPAHAHAELSRSDPAPDSIIERAPARLSLWFSEQPELRFSEAHVVDRNRRAVDRGDLRVEPNDKLGLSVGLPELAPGTYTVTWRVLSAVDGHVTPGAFAFTVGLDQVPTGLAVGAQAESSPALPDEVLFRFLAYLGLLAIVGGFPFLEWVLLPALTAASASRETVTSTLARVWQLATIGIVLAWISQLGSLVVQTEVAFGVPFVEAVGERMASVALGTRFGLLWWVQVALLFGISGVVLLGRRGQLLAMLIPVGTALGGGLLFVRALGSHAAAVPDASAAAVALDSIHLFAVTTWIGGLGYLLATIWLLVKSPATGERLRLGAHLVPRFSTMAAMCVATLLFTGLYQTWLHVGSVPALTGTSYGQALIVKLGLIFPLLALGGVNLLLLSPRLRAASRDDLGQGEVLRRLRQTVASEVTLSVLMLLAVSVMTNLQPARDAFAAQGISRSAQGDGIVAEVRVRPGLAAINRFDVYVTDRSGRPIVDAEKVALDLTMLTHDMGDTELIANPRGDGHYVTQSGALSMAGPWRIEVLVRRSGQDDARVAIQVPIGDQPATNVSAAAANPAEGHLLLGIELLLVAAIGIGLTLWSWTVRNVVARYAAPLALFAATLGGGLTAQGAMALATPRNPFPPTLQSVSRGAVIYAEECAVCHGETGRGDGPAGFGLNPRPADFRVHMAAGHTEGQLYDWVTNGVTGTAMPAWRDRISEEDRWNTINYLRQAFGPGNSAPTPNRPSP
ncbi:MAG: Cytochrome c protein [Chloroflexi bacterium]|nr:Cytochrome c protein [Chloroflexota bacterium]